MLTRFGIMLILSASCFFDLSNQAKADPEEQAILQVPLQAEVPVALYHWTSLSFLEKMADQGPEQG